MKKKLLLLLTLCLFSFSCGENKIAEEDPECDEIEITEDGEFTGCGDCSCPEWAKELLAVYKEQRPPPFWTLLHCLKINGVPYYAITDFSDVPLNPDFFYSDGTVISNDHKDYEILKKIFDKDKFRHSNCNENEEEEGLGCADCPCPGWAKKVLASYRKRLRPHFGDLFFMERNDELYYAILDGTDSFIRPNFFYSDGIAISNDHEDYQTLDKLFHEGIFRFNGTCTFDDEEDKEEDLGCADCPCPEWAEKELASYREQSPIQLGMLYFMERNGVLYYAILNGYFSAIIPNFFYSDGTAISNDHEDYQTLRQLFLERNFQLNVPCTFKFLEEY